MIPARKNMVGLTLKELLYWIIFIAVVLHILGFLMGDPSMPETYDLMR